MKSLLLMLAAIICGCVLTADLSAQVILNRDPSTRETSVSRVGNTTSQTTYELRCRGASRDVNTTPSFAMLSSRPSSTGNVIVTMAMDFERGINPAGSRGEGLKPGQCAWVDRGYGGMEPITVRFETSGNAQLVQMRNGSTVDRSPTAAERFPDQHTIPVYMSNSNNFWVFYAYNTNQGYLQATAHQHWKPSSVSRDQILTRPGDLSTSPVISATRDGIRITPGNIGDTVLRPLPAEVYDPPLLANQVRVVVRYSKEYGNMVSAGSFDVSACNAFSVMGATVLEPVPGGFGNEREVGGSYVRKGGMPIDFGSYWLCSATISSLPFDRDLKVYIKVHPQDVWRTGPWKGGTNLQPPAGYERTITPPFQTVRLTASKTSEIVIFDMVYAPLPSMPR
jgi:hypothetical protein